jgi:flagellar hook assembly protein FlgD
MTADLVVGLAADITDDNNHLLPLHIELSQNYPNPFNPTTRIEFSVSQAGPVRLDIFNIAGQRVRTLLDGYVGPGTTTVDWDALDGSGDPVASGVYLYRLISDDEKVVRKMTLVR